MAPSPTRPSFAVWSGALLALVAFFSLVQTARADSDEPLAGKYRCVRLEFANHSEPCQSPPLILHRDGSYEIWAERGSYEVVQGKWLVLSHSKRRGLGQVLTPVEIVFEYRVDGQTCRVTFKRVFEAPPGFRWG